MEFKFDDQVKDWSNPPLDDIGYLSSIDLLQLPYHKFTNLIHQMKRNRYNGWRNYQGLWRKNLKLDTTFHKKILDFGCGVGMEALEFDGSNKIILADISEANLAVASRIFLMAQRTPYDIVLIGDSAPFCPIATHQVDVVHCSGVLHHIPWAKEILEWFHEILTGNGEVRLMLYSDEGWRLATGTEPPREVIESPYFERFVRYFDAVGSYADWYDSEKLAEMSGNLFRVSEFSYVTQNNQYCIATLVKE